MRRLHAATLFAVSALTFVYFVQKEKQQHPLDKRIRETQHEFTAGRRNLAAGIHQMMGGEVAFRVSSHDILNTEELFSSSPFNPRQYTATGTAFIHYKNATEKDADGETTFPPSKSPIAQYSGWFSPTESPSRAPTKYPVTIDTDGRSSHPIIDSTPDPSRKPVLNPSTYYPTKEPSNKPSKMPTKEPSSDPSNLPSRNPTREPSRGPSKLPTRLPSKGPSKGPTREPSKEPSGGPTREPSKRPSPGPTREPSKGPSKGPTREPSRGPTREPSKGPTREPSRGPTREPSRGPTREPSRMPTRGPTKEPTTNVITHSSPTENHHDGNFYCGSSVYEAGKCETPCPNGIQDCQTGFCYAVSECQEQQEVSPQPTKFPTNNPTENPTGEPKSSKPYSSPTSGPSQYPMQLSTTDFYCGSSFIDASSNCKQSCPAGSPMECPDSLKCYASTGCSGEDLKNPPYLSDPSGSFYCGTSFQIASEQCLEPCPSGVSSDCPPNQACYANTPCGDKNGFYCGTSIVNASASCEFSCLSGLDSDCPLGLTCYETQTCRSWGESESPTLSPKTPNVEEGAKYCGYSYEHAATMCTQPCPNGLSKDCPVGMSCYTHTPCEEINSFYCGLSWNNAASSCRTACPSGTDSDCPSGTHCYAYTTCDETDTFMCGTSFEDAALSCDKPCPSGSPVDCPTTMSCFTHTTCTAGIEEDPLLPPSPSYIPGDSFFCGKSFLEASSQCTDPCPTRSDLECPDGERCYGDTPCPTRETYYCGANLEEASAICDYPCPTGKSEDCPTGLSCFAFTTCADKDSFFCGSNFIEADSSCEVPCPSGLSSDCPQNLTCFAHTTCTKDPVIQPAGPVESYFCGTSFDEATRDCSLPCPTGRDVDCPDEMSCFSHTSCTDRDSFMCGYSWDHAASLCTNPCPSGEHSDCPENMSCFAYTPCNNDGSFFCGTSFDEASTCEYPCPTGSSLDCPDNLSCFSYTACGTGAFDSNSPTSAPVPIHFKPADSFYCGASFEDASRSCEYKCPNGSIDCPVGLACFEFTSCVGREDIPTDTPTGEHDSFFCGANYTDASQKCEVPCPGGTSLECPLDEFCIPFTTCSSLPSNVAVSSTFYCGTSKGYAEDSCEYPCPLGSSDCPGDMECFSFTTCESQAEPEEPMAQTVQSNPFFCGSSFENATSDCSIPCSSGSSSECPVGLSCYGYTSCNDRDSFYCGKDWDDAATSCSKPCPSGREDECDADEVCFGYTPCKIAETDIPVESFYCGVSFAEASMMCADACPSGKHSNCPDGQMCYPYTPCGEQSSFFCGSSWTDAATSCLVPCPSGSSADCPENQLCFPSTPCDEVDSFFCGSNFEDASVNCNIPCESGHSSHCPDGQGCFAYTLCGESGTNAVPTPTLAPISVAPTDSFYCGVSFDDASMVCLDSCPSGLSEDCPGDLLCFASTPCSDRGSFFCGRTWEEAAATCTEPCETGLSSDCPSGQLCFGYTPCPMSESFYCGISFEEASMTCADACPSGEDTECPELETCHKYTPCNDITSLSNTESSALSLPEDSFYCGVNFVEAASKCYLPCPTGSAAECPVGEACYGNTPCSGGDSFFCGVSWYDASSGCRVPCPSGLDEDCPQGSKCFGYTPCSNTDSFYCGADFYDASTTCVRPCPSGLSSECPSGLDCFPNTPCDVDPSYTAPPFSTITPYTKAPSLLTTPLPSPALVELKASSTPHTSMFLYCGVGINSIDCLLPCSSGDDCPLDHECYATQECSDSFYCGESFSMANTTCLSACPDGRDDSCPVDMQCYAQTSCGNVPSTPSKNTVDVGSSYCGRNFTDAASSCHRECLSGSSADCSKLGPDYSCFANTPCNDKDTYYCGASWSHAASNCLFPCPSGDDSDCPDQTSCFPFTTCNQNRTFMCGTSFDHASTCVHPCPSGSSSECPFGESCFTHTTCEVINEQDPTASSDLPYLSESSFYCGASFIEAATQCTEPCPSGLNSDCPYGQECFANTPCLNRETYFCGTSLEEASVSCEHPCPTGQSDECLGNLSCFAFTTCAAKSSYFCGVNFIDASSTCNIPCESGQSSDCPDGLSCFAFTSCQTDVNIAEQEAFCGTSFEDASQDCTNPCQSSEDCVDGEACFPFSACESHKMDYPVESFYCGTTFDKASMTCSDACPSGSHSECPLNQFCFPNTPCQDHSSFYCGSSWTDASTSCLLPCPSGGSDDCPDGSLCFPSTPCGKSDSFFCGASFEEASASCSSPCPSGQSSQCPDGLGCFAYTLCSEDEINALPSVTFTPTPTVPLNSYVCGMSYDDATVSCEYPCFSGLSDDCPGDLLCFAGTSCEASDSFFCGKSWEEAASTCTMPCENGLNSDCPLGEKCFGYTPCANSNTFYCGDSFEEASRTCYKGCPSGLDSDCPGSAICHKYTTCVDGLPAYSSEEEDDSTTIESLFCGYSFDDASVSCTFPCTSRSSTECPVGQACFAHTTCSATHPETFYCGKSRNDANLSCARPCPSGNSNDCPDGTSCFADTTCVVEDVILAQTESIPPTESYFCGTSFEHASAICAQPCPMKTSDQCPLDMHCFAHTTCLSTQSSVQDDTMTTFSSDIPSESYFCGSSYEDASDKCSFPCFSRESSECPILQQCYAFTPCAKPESFFCGSDIDDANDRCAIPCPSGKSNTCPWGESCYAYTSCELTSGNPSSNPTTRLTDMPSTITTQFRTTRPTSKPTQVPTQHPTYKPTLHPTKIPTKYPSKEPTTFPTKDPTNMPTKYPSKKPTTFPTKDPTNMPTKSPTEHPTNSPIVPVFFDVPEASFYCGVTFNHASELCGVACPEGNEDCPPGLTCFGNTPCGDKKSFYCGTSYEDANKKCTAQCPNGSADECPSGLSCFAYTMCKPITGSPVRRPTFEPSIMPTSLPTHDPTPEPTLQPVSPNLEIISTSSPTKSSTLTEMKEDAEPDSNNILVEGMTNDTNDVEEDADKDDVEEDADKEESLEDVVEEKPGEQDVNEETPVAEVALEAVVIDLSELCEDPLAMTVNQAYWRSWSSDRPEICNKFDASDIDATTFTHLVYSFASISADGLLEPWVGSWDEVDKYKEFNKVKDRNPDVKTLIAVTEGVFYGAGMNPTTFNEVAETEKTRWAFAQSVVSFLDVYEFDGIDIDWEAPLDTDKGGSPSNYDNFVSLVREIRSAFDNSKKDFILSVALPPTDWELYDYDVIGLSEHVDWFNLMSFDYHTPKNIPKTVGAHSDLKLIDSVVFELLQGTRSTKFVLGMAAYGRTYTLADHRCQELGCPFRSPGLGGCGNTPGFLPFNEIYDYIESGSYNEMHQDVSSSSMVLVVDQDQMISFDDETTWAIKESYAKMMCLRGTMLWSVDMLIPESSLFLQSHIDEVGDTERKLSYFKSSKPCDICGSGYEMGLDESKSVFFAENSTTCGELSSSFHYSTKELSFKCSIAKTALSNLCCTKLCDMCSPGIIMNADALIMVDEQEMSCGHYELSLKKVGILQGTDRCGASVSPFHDTCCALKDNTNPRPPTLSMAPCNICMEKSVHHELISEAVVEYKGKSISCLEVNSILSKSEFEISETCSATQSLLFDRCCYKKCALCEKNKSLRWDVTVKYSNQILSCNELSSMFTLGIVKEGSEQCDAMQLAYSSICCFDPPKKSCNLCHVGSMSLEVNTRLFVKTKSSSLHCVNLFKALAEREEEGSKICEDSKLAHSMQCCNTSLLPPMPSPTNIYFEWLISHPLPSSSVPIFASTYIWSLAIISLSVMFTT